MRLHLTRPDPRLEYSQGEENVGKKGSRKEDKNETRGEKKGGGGKKRKRTAKMTRKMNQDEGGKENLGREGERLVTRNVIALPTARRSLKRPRGGVFSAKLVMRTLYDTVRLY